MKSNLKVIMGLARPLKEHPKRFVFNYAHRTLGITTFVLSSIDLIRFFHFLIKSLMNLLFLKSCNSFSWCKYRQNESG